MARWILADRDTRTLQLSSVFLPFTLLISSRLFKTRLVRRIKFSVWFCKTVDTTREEIRLLGVKDRQMFFRELRLLLKFPEKFLYFPKGLSY